jgi:hypothetical protein
VKRKTELTHPRVVDYSAARAQAIRWLGDRYLLAKPINARRYGSVGTASTERADVGAAPAHQAVCFPE